MDMKTDIYPRYLSPKSPLSERGLGRFAPIIYVILFGVCLAAPVEIGR